MSLEKATQHNRSFVVLLVVGTGTFLTALAGSSANLILPELSRELGLELSQARWVVQSYLLVLTALLLPVGRVGDLLGLRTVYLWGFALFGGMSLASGLAESLPVLVATRVLQGIGGAMVLAVGPALLTTTFPPEQRGRALGFSATATYVGLALGPPLGGWLLEIASWRATFYLNVPISILILGLGLRLLPNELRHDPPRFDRFGTQMLELFRIRLFTGAVVSALCNYVALFIPMILMPYVLMEGLHCSAGRAGLILSAQPLLMAVSASPSGWLSDRLGSRGLATLGLLVLAAGLFGLATLQMGSTVYSVAVWLALIGLGTGIFIAPNSSALMGSAAQTQQGLASGVLATARNLGMLLGIVLATTVFGWLGGTTGHPWDGQDFAAMRVSFFVASGVAVLGSGAALLRGGRKLQR